MELLRFAIVENACKEYEWALRYIDHHKYLTLSYAQEKQMEKAKRFVSDCENFFRGGWFKVLMDIDGERLMKMLRKRALTEKRGITRHKIK